LGTYPEEDNIWEALQLINGDIFIYHKGFKEEALMKDVFKYVAGKPNKFTRCDIDFASPVKDSVVRLNRSVIVFAWYIDPDSDLVRELKKFITDCKG
jgi:hypothetical protein